MVRNGNVLPDKIQDLPFLQGASPAKAPPPDIVGQDVEYYGDQVGVQVDAVEVGSQGILLPQGPAPLFVSFRENVREVFNQGGSGDSLEEQSVLAEENYRQRGIA